MRDLFLNIEKMNENLNNWNPYMHACVYMDSLTDNSVQYK
jgi:hypothetical protein